MGENTGKLTAFLVPIKKEIDKNGKEITKAISYRLQSIDSTRFMASSLSVISNNIAKIIHKIICKYQLDDKKCETWSIKCKDGDYFLE